MHDPALLLKESLLEELIQAIYVVMDGQMYLSSAVTDIVVSDFRNRRKVLLNSELEPFGLKQLKIWGGTGYAGSEVTFNYQLMAKTGNEVVNGLHLLTAKQPL